MINVLYVDDELHNLNAFKASFRRLFNVYIAESAIEARKVLDGESIDIIISDHLMPVTTGIDFLKSIVRDFPRPVRMLLTGYADANAVSDAINEGLITKCIAKPWVLNDLQNEIESAYDSINS